MRFIMCNVMAYSPIMRSGNVSDSWPSQSDETQHFGGFESLAFRDVQKVFMIPLYQFITSDDDLFGTRAKDNAVKHLSPRKGDVKGRVADCVEDALFSCSKF